MSRRGRPPKNRYQLTGQPSGGEASGPVGIPGDSEGQEEKSQQDTGEGVGAGLQGKARRGKGEAGLPPTVADALESKTISTADRNNIPNLPVFADEEDKLAFEESLNVDLSQVGSFTSVRSLKLSLTF